MVIPESVVPLWDDAAEVQGQLNAISTLGGILKSAEEKSNLIFVEINFQSAKSAIGQLYADWKRARPHAVCPQCLGEPAVKSKECQCKGRGFVSEFFWDSCVPQEVKDLRSAVLKAESLKE
jgi:hypothetical protein